MTVMELTRRTRFPDPKCPHCRGFGIFFIAEVEGSMTAVARRCPCTRKHEGHNMDVVAQLDRWLKLRIEDETRAMDKAQGTGLPSNYAMHEYGRRLCYEIRQVLQEGT